MDYNPNTDGLEPEAGGTFELLPVGRYRFTIEKSEPRQWEKSGETYWNLQLSPIEPAGHNKHVWYKLNFPSPVNEMDPPSEQAKQRRWLKNAMWDWKAVGIKFPLNTDNDASTIEGRVVTADVKHRKYMKDGQERAIEDIRALDPDAGPGSVSGGEVTQAEAESEVPF